jgi:hypothetical protein
MQSAEVKNSFLIVRAGIYFLLSTIITWLFIVKSPLYFSSRQQILSCSIAGAKWGIQILLALLFLGIKKWVFIERIGFTCLIGSIVLLPYYFSAALSWNSSSQFFTGSLIVAILAMIVSYYRNIKSIAVNVKWWLFWLACLAIAISLQLTLVFHVINF